MNCEIDEEELSDIKKDDDSDHDSIIEEENDDDIDSIIDDDEKIDDDAEELEQNEELEESEFDDENDADDAVDFEEKKKPVAKRKNKMMLFSFIKKIKPRRVLSPPKNYTKIDCREKGLFLLKKIKCLKNKDHEIFEKAIFKFCNRHMEEQEVFEELYCDKIRQVLGTLYSGLVKKTILLKEIRDDVSRWASIIFKDIIEEDQIKTKKLMTVLDIEESDEYECRCGNKKVFKVTVQLRSGDEPPSSLLKCSDKKCSHTWRSG